MRFNSVTIKNFRNFEDILVDLTNKNVLFGMNDVGKTNFLYALRYVFDKDIRKQNFSDTDYYKKKVEIPIEIVIAIDISDTENADSQKLRAKLKGAILSNQDIVYIKVKADYDEKEMMGIPVLYWGGNLEELEEMKVHGTFYEIDYVFNAIYIDAYVDLYTLFKKNANKLLVNDKDQDKDILDSICKTCDELNAQISGLSGIRAFEEKIAPEYKKFRHDDISVSVKSEIAIKGLYSNIVPYIKQDTDDSLYPTSGEGRKKLLVYAIFDLLSQEEEEKKINIFLIEEPENHLHRSMQIALSHILFLDDKYQYLFMTTHSPYVLTEMDRVNLVRIYNEDKIVSRSVLYTVPTKFKSQRKMLNRGLVEAIFADKVLLVEGPSENVLFGKVLSEINPFYEADGIYILPVGGFGFGPYYETLDALQIDNIIKTDNDLRKIKGKEEYSVLGFSKDNRIVCNILSGDIVEHDKALGNANVIVTNPPFASIKGMSKKQKNFLKMNYPLANCDTCVAFMEAIGNLLCADGVCGIVSQNAWMYLKSFSEAREKYVSEYYFRYIVNLGSGAFIDLSGEKSNVSLIVFEKKKQKRVPCVKVINLSMDSLSDKIKKLITKEGLFEINQDKLNGVNGFVLSNNNALDMNYEDKEQYSSSAVPMQGTSTGNAKELVGYFWEHFDEKEWIPVSKGGGYCRWEGLNNSVVKWGENGEYIKKQKGSALRNIKYFGKTQLVFSDTGTAGLNVRLLLNNQIFIASGPGIRILQGNEYAHMAFLNSRLAANYVRTISPKLTIAAGYIGRIPVEPTLLCSTVLERKARLCVNLKCKHLQSRPNNLEYIDITQVGNEIDLNQQAWELFKSDILNELLKLEVESQCDEIILSEFSLNEVERNALSKAVGECAFRIKTVQEVDITKFDKYLAKLLDDACMLKRSRTSKASLGCDGMLEYVAKDLKINPTSLVEQICQSFFMMQHTLEKYKDLIIHNYLLHEMGYSVTTGVVKEKINSDELIESFESVYGKQLDMVTFSEPNR